MSQQFSVLILIFFISISAENSNKLSKNVLQSIILPTTKTNRSAIKTKTIISNEKPTDSNVYSFDGTEASDILDYTTASPARPSDGAKSLEFLRKTRFPRQANRMSYAKSDGGDSGGRRDIKVVLDVRSDEDNIYDDEHYGDGKYYDDYHRARIVNNVPTIDLWNTNGEMENDYSEPVTGTLSESQERKRCARILGSAGGRPSGLVGYGLLKSNGRPAGVQNSGDSRPGRINDDYLINVLKQLIEKLHRNKTVSSTRHRSLSAVRKSSGQESGSTDRDPAAMSANISSSAEDEWIFKLEKTKGDRIIDWLNSSPEKTFVNGKWLKNKLTEGNDDCGGSKPAAANANYITGGSNVPKNDNRLTFDLKNPENQHVVTADTDGHEYPNGSQTASGGGDAGKRPAENKEVSTSPSRPAAVDNQQHVLASRETVGPLYWSSTAKFTDSGTTADENNKRKYTTVDTTDDDEEVDSISDDYTSSPVTAESTLDSNDALHANRPDRILESNVYENKDNLATGNYSEGPAIAAPAADSESSVENERDPFGNDANDHGGDCNCNKKIIKNVLSSIMIKNVTEIKTDSYPADTSLANKTKGYKRSNKSLTASESPAGRANVKRAKNIFSDNGGGGSTTSKRLLTKFPSRDEIVAELKLKRLQFEERVKTSNENRRNMLGKIKIKSEPTNSSDDSLWQTVRRKITEKSTPTFILGKKNAGNVLREKNTAANNIPANRKITPRPDGPNKNRIVVSDVDNYSARNEPKTTLGREHVAKFGEKPAKSVKFEHDDHVNSKTASNTSNEYNHAGKTTKRILSDKSSTPRSSTTETKKTSGKLLGDSYVTANKRTSGYPIGASENVIGRKNRQKNRDNYYSNDVKLTGKPTGLDGNADGGAKTTPKRTKTKTTGDNRRPTENGEIASTLTSKKSLVNGGNAAINAPAALFFDGGSVAVEYDIPNKPTAAVRETGGPKSKFNPGRVLSKPKQPKAEPYYRTADDGEYDDPEHGPYNAGDLNPIVFDGQTPAGRKSSGPTGSRRSDGVQRASSPSSGSRPLFRNALRDNHQPLQQQRQQQQEYNDDGNTNRKNTSSVTVDDGGGDIASDYGNWRNPIDHKPRLLNNQSRFDVLHRVKVADGVFKIPLVSHSAVDANGSAQVSDIFIPIVKHDGRHTAVSLTELLAGDFQLSQDDDEDPPPSPPSSASSTLRQSSSARSGHEQDGHDVGDGMTVAVRPTSVLVGTVDDILKRVGADGAEKTPVQVIQIINNGLCRDRCNVTADKAANAKSVRDPNSAVVAKARNEGNKPRPVLSLPNLRDTRRKIENAYNHFDSEILDRFLQVYTPR